MTNVVELHSEAGATAPQFSEEALALDFATRHASKLRYVAAWNKWFIWDGTVWRMDETRKVFSLARALCREVVTEVNRPNERRRIASAKTRAAVVNLAGEDRRLAATIGQWDADPWLLNTPGGVVNLRTGVVREHRPEDYMTKITAFAPGGDCPRWKKFLKQVTKDGDEDEKAKYLQRASGYSLTGSVSEHVLFFLYGDGRNGKGVFLRVVAGVMGDYHASAPIEVFLESKTDRHPTELAALMGARMVTSVEPERGRRWNETRITHLTGGDPIDARFMRQDFFRYTPQFKLFFSGNHKPGLRSVNTAISSRVNIVPFTVTIPEKDRIKDFDKVLLEAEGPGILRWAVDGCLAWQRDGLAPPNVVKDATKSYLQNENVQELWIDERCDQSDAQVTTATSELYYDWKAWTEARNEFTGSHKSFTNWLGGKFELGRNKYGPYFIGLKLRSAPGPRTRQEGDG